MLRQSGMNAQTEVVYRMTIYSILCVILVPLICWFLQVIALTNVTFGVILIYLVIFVAEYFVISVVLKYGFGKYSSLANIFYTLISVVVCVVAALSPSIS